MSAALRPEVEQRLDIVSQPTPGLEAAPLFLARAAIQNQIEWEKVPEEIPSLAVDERFTFLDSLYDYAMETPKVFFTNLTPGRARERLTQKWDFLQRIKAGESREHIINEIHGTEVNPRMSQAYAKMVGGLQNAVEHMMATCRLEQAKGRADHIALPEGIKPGALRKILMAEPDCEESDISIVEARWLGWSDEQLELGFGRNRRHLSPIFHKYVPILAEALGEDSPIVQAVANQRRKPVRAKRRTEKPEFLSEEERQEYQERFGFLQKYSKELLTAEQEVELGFKIQAGKRAEKHLEQMTSEGKRSLKVDGVTYTIAGVRHDIREGKEAFFTFLAANKGLAFWAIKKWRNVFATLDITLNREVVEDIASDIFLDKECGLWQAIERFDPTRGVKFSTYATYWLHNAVFEAAGKRQPIPMSGAKISNVFYKRAQHHRLKEKQAAGEALDEEPLHMFYAERAAESLIFGTDFRSTDDYRYGNGDGTSQTEGDFLTHPDQLYPGEDNAIVAAGNCISMELILEKALNEQEIQVVTRMFFSHDPLSAKACAAALGCSMYKVGLLRKSALEKLRPHLEDIKDLF